MVKLKCLFGYHKPIKKYRHWYHEYNSYVRTNLPTGWHRETSIICKHCKNTLRYFGTFYGDEVKPRK